MADLYVDTAIKATRPLIVDEIKKAFDEGYKAGVADFAPGSAYWESYSASLAKETKPGPTWGTVAVGTGAGVLVGFALGIAGSIVLASLQ